MSVNIKSRVSTSSGGLPFPPEMGVEATVETVIQADRKTVAGSAAEAQGWNLQRLKSLLKTDADEPKADVEAPKAEDIKPLPYSSLYRYVSH